MARPYTRGRRKLSKYVNLDRPAIDSCLYAGSCRVTQDELQVYGCQWRFLFRQAVTDGDVSKRCPADDSGTRVYPREAPAYFELALEPVRGSIFEQR